MAANPALFHTVRPTLGTYGFDTAHTIADAEAPDFFNPIAASVPVGFMICCQMSDSQPQSFHPHLRVVSNDGTSVITEVALA